MPTGCRTQFIPGLTKNETPVLENYTRLYNENPFSEVTIAAGNQVMELLAEGKRQKWASTLESVDLPKNSHKG